MMETVEVLGVDPQDEVDAENTTSSIAPQHDDHADSTQVSTHATNAPSRNTAYPMITDGSQPSHTAAPVDKGQKKRKGLTPEQKQKLQKIQQEQETIRKERVATLSQKLLDKISVWVETDRSAIVTEAFKTKMQVFATS
jgi:hypothetical protein